MGRIVVHYSTDKSTQGINIAITNGLWIRSLWHPTRRSNEHPRLHGEVYFCCVTKVNQHINVRLSIAIVCQYERVWLDVAVGNLAHSMHTVKNHASAAQKITAELITFPHHFPMVCSDSL